MHIPSIKSIVEKYSLTALREAEEAILNESTPSIEIPGEDEGEQLTHVIAAIEILEDMKANNTDYKTALRAYTVRVRKSID